MIATRTPVPDLLKRFVPTRFKLIAKGATIETNDLDLLEHFEVTSGSTRLASIAPNYHIRVIRDPGAPTGSDEVRIVCEDKVCILLVGYGTVIMVDREQRRVFGFLASDISNQRFAQVYLPLAMNHSFRPHAE